MDGDRVWDLDERVCEAIVLKGTAICCHSKRRFADLKSIPRGVSQVQLTEGTQFLIIPANEDINIKSLHHCSQI